MFGKLCVRTPNDAERGLLAVAKDAETEPAEADILESNEQVAAAPSGTDDYAPPREPVGSVA